MVSCKRFGNLIIYFKSIKDNLLYQNAIFLTVSNPHQMNYLMISLCFLLFSQLLYAYLKQKVDEKDIVYVFIFSLFLRQF